MTVLRTPDECFDGISDWPYEPNYLDVAVKRHGPLRTHYVDEGAQDGHTILCLHGQGTWGYIFRKAVPVFVAAGFRVVVPDFIGFGRSDKLVKEDDYEFQDFVDWLNGFIDTLKLEEATAFAFDWGGFFALRIAGDRPEFFSRLVPVNTRLPHEERPDAEWFENWRTEMLAKPVFPMGGMVNTGVSTPLTDDVIAAYDAPYPHKNYKAAPRRFPMIMPVRSSDPNARLNANAWARLATWPNPVLCLSSHSMEGTANGPAPLIAHLPGAKGQPHHVYPDGKFFLPEDEADDMARRIVEWIGKQ